MSRTADLKPVNIAFASGTEAANVAFLQRFSAEWPGVPLLVVSEFPVPVGEWIPWHVLRPSRVNLEAIRTVLGDRPVDTIGFVLHAHPPLRKMKFAAMRLRPRRLVAFDHQTEPVAVSVAGLAGMFRHGRWRVRTFLGKQFGGGGRGRLWVDRLANPKKAEVPLLARRALLYGSLAGKLRGRRAELPMRGAVAVQRGVSVVIPSRDGKELLARLFPTLFGQFADGEVIVSDNGSSDGTAEWVAANYPEARVIRTATPLSFAKAVNLGIADARYSHVFLLNNDMVLYPDCVAALWETFAKVPDLFCATAQIFFPEGVRREETGKAVWRVVEPLDFPVRCDDPLEGEDGTWVMYGSGGCSMFDTEKLRDLGGVSEVYEPAYVEDMDFGYRAWKRGWPTVYCAGAKVEHRHRATTARFYNERELQFFVERNYLRFLIYSIGSKELFQELWRRAIRRLQMLAMRGDMAALDALRRLPRIVAMPEAPRSGITEEAILALGNGDVAVFPGRGRTDYSVLIASPYLPYPLSHGGAVRMFNLMRENNRTRGQVLVSFVDRLETPPAELLEICAEVVLVRRHGSHYRKETELPDVVEEFASETFRAALGETVRKWAPAAAQLEFTQMAQYAEACKPARTLLVEHDVTFDLLEQMVAVGETLELQQQLHKWKRFETAAWGRVNQVVTMSSKDSETVGPKAVCLPNGVDTERFQPFDPAPERGRILFIGSFAHLPNLLGLAWFVREVWPLLGGDHTLHVIAGARHEYFLDFYRSRVEVDFAQPGIEVEGFVSDVREEYRRAAVVIAPLRASAGTNIKVLEAMAMGKRIVSTTAGVNGLDVADGRELAIADDAAEFAAAIRRIAGDSGATLGATARRAAVAKYDWRAIGEMQARLYNGEL